MRRTKREQETDQIWARGEGKQNTGRQDWHLLLPPGRRVPRLATSNGDGGWGALEASRDQETGQTASRAVPVPGPMAELGARAAMADQGAWAAMAGQGTRAAMADQGAWAAMAGQGTLWPWPLSRPHRPWLYSPPKKILGKSDSWGRSGSAAQEGAVKERHRRALLRSWHWAWVSSDRQTCHTHCRQAWESRGRRRYFPCERRAWGSCERRREFPRGRPARESRGQRACVGRERRRLAWAANGGGLAWAANGGGLGRAADGGRVGENRKRRRAWESRGRQPGLFWLGAGHSPDTGGFFPSILVQWCLGGPRDNENWPRARTARGRRRGEPAELPRIFCEREIKAGKGWWSAKTVTTKTFQKTGKK